MWCVPTNRWVLVVVAMLFAVGHGYEESGKFFAHHHGPAHQHGHGGVDGGRPADDAGRPGANPHQDSPGPLTDADHCLAHHGVVALLPTVPVLPGVDFHHVSLHAAVVKRAPEAPAVGIDHPPQLA